MSKERISVFLIALLHVVGAMGTVWSVTSDLMKLLTPLNLLISASLLVLVDRNKVRVALLFLIAFSIGYLSEVIGVKTGAIFGEYRYGPTLGPQLFEVPLIIGINWFILSYVFRDLSIRLTSNRRFQVVLAALGMTALDWIIEPVAISLDYWQWASGTIPIQNFLGWFLIAIIIQLIISYLRSGLFRNTLSPWLLAAQLFYFLTILIIQ